MKPAVQAYHFKSLLIVALFSTSLLWKSSHVYFDFHHAESLHCEDKEHSPHIHDDRFAVHDCFVCAFQFSQFEENSVFSFQNHFVFLHREKPVVRKSIFDFTPGVFVFLRGPPAAPLT
ncbi:MAG TPA: hypothetical protein PKC40_10900, partial [Saprospiraceae bacterium]|nr:hypothetical protein [Saprospiraceae bacterium]